METENGEGRVTPHGRWMLAGRRVSVCSVPNIAPICAANNEIGGEGGLACRSCQAAAVQPSGLKTRSVEAGNLTSLSAGRRGRETSSPPQLGHMPPLSRFFTQSTQKVHSNVQMRASGESPGRSLLQHSQLGRSSSMSVFLAVIVVMSGVGRARKLN